MTATKSATSKRVAANNSGKIWTDEERAAMQASVQERKAAARRGPADERAEGEREVAAQDRRACRRPIASWPSGSTSS